ncbi:MAG: hypothetical protein WC485_06480, partial [Opitutaceae bacterium]
MIHLLIIAEDSVVLPPTAALSSSVEFTSLRKPDLDSARPLLDAGMFDVCVMAVGAPPADASRAIQEFRALAPRCALIVTLPQGLPAEEQAAYLAGADVVLAAPFGEAAFLAVIGR